MPNRFFPRRVRGVTRTVARSLVCGLALCASIDVPAAERLVIAVAARAHQLPLFVAQDRGFFAAEGLDIEFRDCADGYRCLENVVKGEADVGSGLDMALAAGSFEPHDWAVIGTIAGLGYDLKMVVRPGGRIEALGDLLGKRIGVVFGSPGAYLLDQLLLTRGVDPASIDTVPMLPNAMAKALKAGEVEAVVLNQSNAVPIAAAMGDAVKVVPLGPGRASAIVLVAHRRLLGARDPALVHLLRAIEQAERYIQHDQAAARAILLRHVRVDPALLDQLWPTLTFRLALDQALIATLESEARWVLREGSVKGNAIPNFLEAVHAGPLRAVKPGAVGIDR